MPSQPNAPLAEIDALQRIIDLAAGHAQVRSWASAAGPDGQVWPVLSVALGNPSPQVPAVGFFGGVHGLERIGAQVVIAWLASLVARLRWDSTLHALLDGVRLVFMPVVNPGGMARHTRANPRGVDLMRNAPVDAREPVPFLIGGQRLSAGLPWYRGRAGDPMEPESAALCELVRSELHGRPFGLALDCHSGFGLLDRIWFPYAHRRGPVGHLAQLHALHEIFLDSNPHHPYVFEPQSSQYLAHGDLWDYLYLQACEQHGAVFLPLTLEMGSWIWVKKNPRQLFSRRGIFNPLIAHRQQRVLRRHLPLLDFLVRATAASAGWLPMQTQAHHRRGMARWFRGGA